MGHDGTVNDFLFTYLDSIDEQLLEYLDDDDEVHGLPASLAKRAGIVHLLSVSARVGRPSNARLEWSPARLLRALPHRLSRLRSKDAALQDCTVVVCGVPCAHART